MQTFLSFYLGLSFFVSGVWGGSAVLAVLNFPMNERADKFLSLVFMISLGIVASATVLQIKG